MIIWKPTTSPSLTLPPPAPYEFEVALHHRDPDPDLGATAVTLSILMWLVPPLGALRATAEQPRGGALMGVRPTP
jgi:hypothetical protein